MTDSQRVERLLIDEPGVARALRMTLVACLGATLIVSVFTASLGWSKVPRLTLLAAALIAVGLVLAHSGRIRTGIFVALAAIAYAVLYVAAFNSGVQSVGLATIPLLIVVGSLVLDGFTFVLFSGAAILSTAVMLAIRDYVLQRAPLTKGDLGDFFIFAVICTTAALVGRLIAKRIHEGFELVRASERRYRRMFENIQDVYFETGPDGTLLEVSPGGATLFGLPRQEMIGRPLADFCEVRTECEVLLSAVAQEGRVTNREILARKLNDGGVPVLINASIRRDRYNCEERIVGSIRDITERKESEEALREKEERLRVALEAADAGTFDFYPELKKLIWSDATKAHFGISVETAISYDLFQAAIHPEDRERVLQAERDVAVPGSGGKLAIEFRAVGVEDGKERWLAVHGRMFFDHQNRAARLTGTVVDVSQRKRVDEELRRRAEELQTIMDVAPVALFTAEDPGCRVVTGNRAAYAMLELAEPENLSVSVPGIPVRRFLRGDTEIPAAEMPLQTAVRGLEVRDCEMNVSLPHGKRMFWGHASPLYDSSGHVRGAIAAFVDVTEARQRTEDLLRESEGRFRSTADACPVIIWFGDERKRLVFANKQMARFTGRTVEELLGHGWAQVIHPDDLERSRTEYYRAVDGRLEHQLEYRARRADGEYRQMLATTSPRYVGTKYAGQVGSVIDITDVKRRQEETATREKLESIGMLASGIAHDFNNLLGSVLAQSEFALEELRAGESPENELKRIADVAARGSEIVRQLMIYAGAEGAEQAGLVEVSSTVQDMLELLRVSITKHAMLEFDPGADLPEVCADASQIRQVVMNLVTNASEAMSERDGVIEVSTRCVTAGPDTLGASGEGLPEATYIELNVSDTGCGVSPETRARMFDPFFSTKSAGRGLGLAVVQGIVRSLNGAIRVESEAGKRTTFRVLLPCAALTGSQPVRQTVSAVRELVAELSPAAILVVEDEQFLRQAVSTILRRKGLSVLEAGDGSVAIDTIREHRDALDIILLDVSLPGASSHEVLKEARALAPRSPVIATSAYGEDRAIESLEGLPEYFIRKPYRLTELVDLIGRALAGSPRSIETA